MTDLKPQFQDSRRQLHNTLAKIETIITAYETVCPNPNIETRIYKAVCLWRLRRARRRLVKAIQK